MINKTSTNKVKDIIDIKHDKPFNKLAHKIEDIITANRRIIVCIHWVMFLLFIALILIPPFLQNPPEDATALNNFTLFVKFILWGLWFPLLLLSVIILGRAWCGLLCPQGAVSEYISMRGVDKRPPSWITWEGTPILSFIFVTILGQLVGVRDYPLPMLEIFGGTMVVAFIIGFIYTSKHRTWCRFLCPIGLLLGIFSRLGMVNFEGKLSKRKNVSSWKKTLCPTFIDLSKKSTSRYCIECFKCANWKNPNTLKLSFRKPGKEIEEIAKSDPFIYEILFLFSVIGIALGAFHWQADVLFKDYKWILGSFFLDHGLGGFIGKSGPWWIMSNYPELGEVFNWLDVISITTYMLGFIFLFLGVLSFLNYISTLFVYRDIKKTKKLSKKEIFIQLGYIYTPVALLSLFLGLGGSLFQSMKLFGLDDTLIYVIKSSLFFAGLLWSLYLAYKIIKSHGAKNIFLPFVPQFIGVIIVFYGWASFIL